MSVCQYVRQFGRPSETKGASDPCKNDMGFPSGRYLPPASLPLRAALRGRGLVLLRADLFARTSFMPSHNEFLRHSRFIFAKRSALS